MTTNVAKVCSICGALLITITVNGAPVETCPHDGRSACPEPRIESRDIHMHGPDSALVVRASTELRPIIAAQRFDDPWLEEDETDADWPSWGIPQNHVMGMVADDEPAPEDAVPMNVARFAPAAHFFGPIAGVAISASIAYGALMLHDAQGNDVTELHRA
jgi:hypothetical protein